MAPQPGLALLGLLVPGHFLLVVSPLGPYGAWGVVALALLLCRRDPDLRAGVPAALAVLAACIAFALVGSGVTFGTSAGPIATAGDETTQPLGLLGFFAPGIAPAAVVLAFSKDEAVRRLARWSLPLLALIGAVAAATLAWPPDRLDGTYASRAGLLFLVLALVHLLVILAFLLPPLRAAAAWAQRPPSEA